MDCVRNRPATKHHVIVITLADIFSQFTNIRALSLGCPVFSYCLSDSPHRTVLDGTAGELSAWLGTQTGWFTVQA